MYYRLDRLSVYGSIFTLRKPLSLERKMLSTCGNTQALFALAKNFNKEKSNDELMITLVDFRAKKEYSML